jgi:hypothetical protein
MGPAAGLKDVKKLKLLTPPGLELRPLHCPDRSKSFYRLSYRDIHIYILYIYICMKEINIAILTLA